MSRNPIDGGDTHIDARNKNVRRDASLPTDLMRVN